MQKKLSINIITIFPAMLQGVLGESILKRAQTQGAVNYGMINLRDFTTDSHKSVDDRPYGGGTGMIMKPEPLFKAVESIRTKISRVILMTPQGERFNQKKAQELAKQSHLIFLCCHYEGVDERVRKILVTDEISIGDYILTNGTLAAAVVVDAVVRLLPGVLGGGNSAIENESFQHHLLEYPQYTRPDTFRGMAVPEILRSGDHQKITRWREEYARKRTMKRRPDLLKET